MNNVISYNARETTTKQFETSQKYVWSDKSIVFIMITDIRENLVFILSKVMHINIIVPLQLEATLYDV